MEGGTDALNPDYNRGGRWNTKRSAGLGACPAWDSRFFDNLIVSGQGTVRFCPHIRGRPPGRETISLPGQGICHRLIPAYTAFLKWRAGKKVQNRRLKRMIACADSLQFAWRRGSPLPLLIRPRPRSVFSLHGAARSKNGRRPPELIERPRCRPCAQCLCTQSRDQCPCRDSVCHGRVQRR